MEKELQRKIVLEYLAERPLAAFTPGQISRNINLHKLADEQMDEASVRECCVFLEGMGMVSKVYGTLGASENWQITTKGTLTWERGV